MAEIEVEMFEVGLGSFVYLKLSDPAPSLRYLDISTTSGRTAPALGARR